MRCLILLFLILSPDWPSNSYLPDSNSYIQPAITLLHQASFGSTTLPEIRRTPGYSVLLIPGLASNHMEIITLILQILLSSFCTYCTYYLALQLQGSKRVAHIAALLYALEPISIYYTSQLMPETLFTFFALTAIITLIRTMQNSSIPWAMGSGLLWASATFTKPIFYFYPLLPLTILFIHRLFTVKNDSKTNFSNQVKTSLISLITYSILVGSWQVRNYELTGYRGFATISDINLYFYMAAAVKAQDEKISFSEMQKKLGYGDAEKYFSNHPEQKTWSETQIANFVGKKGATIIKSNLLKYAKIHLFGSVRTLFEPGAMPYLSLLGIFKSGQGLLGKVVDNGIFSEILQLLKNNPGTVIGLAFFGTITLSLYLLFIYGLIDLYRLKSLHASLIFFTCLYFVLLAGGPTGNHRFRHPIMPYICCLAGIGIQKMLDRQYLIIKDK